MGNAIFHIFRLRVLPFWLQQPYRAPVEFLQTNETLQAYYDRKEPPYFLRNWGAIRRASKARVFKHRIWRYVAGMQSKKSWTSTTAHLLPMVVRPTYSVEPRIPLTRLHKFFIYLTPQTVSSHIILFAEIDNVAGDLARLENRPCILKKHGVDEKEVTLWQLLGWTNEEIVRTILKNSSPPEIQSLESVGHTSIGILDPPVDVPTTLLAWRRKNVVTRFAKSHKLDDTDWIVIDGRRSILSLTAKQVYSSKHEADRNRNLFCHFNNWNDLLLLYFSIYLSLWGGRRYIDSGEKIPAAVQTRLRTSFDTFHRLKTESGWRNEIRLLERAHTNGDQLRVLCEEIVPTKGDTIMIDTKQINILGSTVSAPVIVADQIQNSFNTVAQSTVDDSVKQLLSTLMTQVAEASKSAPLAVAESMARDVESLSKEVISTKPRRKFFEITVEGLKEAAIAVGDVGRQILETTGQLLPLLIKLFP